MKKPKDVAVHILKTKSELVGAILQKEFPGGEVNPERLLEIISSPRHPLHKYIDWSEENAVRNYRLRQVEQLIRTAKMTVRYGRVERAAPLYVHRPGADRLYVAVGDIRLQTEKGLALMDALRAVRGHVERLSGLVIALGYDPTMFEAFLSGLEAFEVELMTPPKVETTPKRRVGKGRHA